MYAFCELNNLKLWFFVRPTSGGNRWDKSFKNNRNKTWRDQIRNETNKRPMHAMTTCSECVRLTLKKISITTELQNIVDGTEFQSLQILILSRINNDCCVIFSLIILLIKNILVYNYKINDVLLLKLLISYVELTFFFLLWVLKLWQQSSEASEAATYEKTKPQRLSLIHI